MQFEFMMVPPSPRASERKLKDEKVQAIRLDGILCKICGKDEDILIIIHGEIDHGGEIAICWCPCGKTWFSDVGTVLQQQLDNG